MRPCPVAAQYLQGGCQLGRGETGGGRGVRGDAHFLQSSDTASTQSTAMGASRDECMEITLELSDVVALLMSVSRSSRSTGIATLFRICPPATATAHRSRHQMM